MSGTLTSSVMKISPMSTFVSLEFVFSETDFLVSVNDPVIPSECVGFSLNEYGCLVFHRHEGDLVSFPVPDPFIELITVADTILCVKFNENGVDDFCELLKVQCHVN